MCSTTFLEKNGENDSKLKPKEPQMPSSDNGEEILGGTSRKNYDDAMIGQYLLNICFKCIKRNVLQKLYAYPTFHSRVIAYVLFLEHLRLYRF